MAAEPFGDTFKGADLTRCVDGSEVAVAVEKTTAKVKFKRSIDGGPTWPIDGDAIEVSTITEGPKSVTIEQPPHSPGLLRVTNGHHIWDSKRGGVAGSWTAV